MAQVDEASAGSVQKKAKEADLMKKAAGWFWGAEIGTDLGIGGFSVSGFGLALAFQGLGFWAFRRL